MSIILLIDKDIDTKEITVFKMVGVDGEQIFPACKKTHIPLTKGINEADTSTMLNVGGGFSVGKGTLYNAGFHCFINKEDAEEFKTELLKYIDEDKEFIIEHAKEDGETIRDEYKVIECTVKKEWITAIGLEEGVGKQQAECIVADKIQI